MSNFMEALEQSFAWKLTENGQDALNTTFDANLDLFSTIGALRNRSDEDITNKFAKAYAESPLTAIKMLFYARDIKEGLGERRIFRLGLEWLGNFKTADAIANIPNIVKFGRFDDLYCLIGTQAESAVWDYIIKQWNQDIANYRENKPLSLMAKWLKSVNTSSAESRELGLKTAKALGMSARVYRKNLSALRARLNVLEQTMTKKEWEAIDFNTVPGAAMKKYHEAFSRHQGERFGEYLNAVQEHKTVKVTMADGTIKEVEAKVNTKHLYPYEIVEKYTNKGWGCRVTAPDPAYETMWQGLKDWINGAEANMLIMADTSGSMSGRPMATSVGLAIYFAERNKGLFHGKYMTFSGKPSLISIKDNQSLAEKINFVDQADWGMNTNLEAAFDKILDAAVSNHIPQEDMPKSLVIITDMEFDSCVRNSSYEYEDRWSRSGYSQMTFYDNMKARFAAAGYVIPEIVFWNVNARNDTYHTTAYVKNVRMVSGQATSVFKSLIDGKTHTPYEFMLETVYADRYDSVVLGK